VIGFGPVLVRRAPVWFLVLLVSGASFGPTPSAARVRGARNCDVRVGARASLSRAMSQHGSETTYCLARGTFRVTTTIKTDTGDRVIGAGRNATFIDGSGLPETSVGIFLISGSAYFSRFDISGAPTPTVGSGVFCSPDRSRCGRAFHIGSQSLTLRSIDCHDNGNNCVGGGGNADVTVHDIDCYHNGNAYSMISSFRSAACIKRAAIYSSGGNTTVTKSDIHDNPWVGIWCDHCKYGAFSIRDNRITHNGANGIQWEMSGGWTSEDHAVIRNNTIRRNNYLEEASFRGGIGISTANDMLVEQNVFGSNYVAAVNVIFTSGRNAPQPDSRGVIVEGNAMNGDDISGCSLAGVVCTGNS
jgi:Right handed beta helix region